MITCSERPGTYADGQADSLRHPTYTITKPGYSPFPNDLLISPRFAPQMIGLGLLQSVPEATLNGLANPDDSNSDGTSGRPNIVWDAALETQSLGRFGWKANQPTLLQQNAGAVAGDIGISTSLFPKQNCSTAQTECAEIIHGNPELSNQTFHTFTDLLLHDMGPDLADNRPDFAASGSEWRTPLLWGLGLVPTVNQHHFLLHDGRARGFEEAILSHGGEGEAAKETFRNLPKANRDSLVAFLNSL